MADPLEVCPLYSRLTEMEHQFFLLFLQGDPMKEIAAAMNISPQYASQIKKSVLRKLELSTDVGLVLYGVRRGLLGLFYLRDQAA